METIASRICRAALDLVAPPRCAACDAAEVERAGLCVPCRRRLRPPTAAPCPRCAAALGPGVDPACCAACEVLRPKFVAAVSAGRYAGLFGELIRRAKYGRDVVLCVPLADALVAAVGDWEARDAVTCVAAVPPSPRSRGRGFHLASALAEAVADALRVPDRPQWLVRVGDPRPQASLPRTERRRAARGTVALRPPGLLRRSPRVTGERVLVVDDVMTTGATVNECARVLRRAGAAEVRVAVCARA